MKTKMLLSSRRTCSRCGKTDYSYYASGHTICEMMYEKKICWECAYWEWFKNNLPDGLEIIGNRCYQILPYIEKVEPDMILGDNGKVHRILRRDGSFTESNDIWWINTIPYQYQQEFKPTAWFISRRFYEKLERSQHICHAKGCLDRYHCYRYDYRSEFNEEGPYNKVPNYWIVGDERCPAFLPLKDIQGYDEFTTINDIIDESSEQTKPTK